MDGFNACFRVEADGIPAPWSTRRSVIIEAFLHSTVKLIKVNVLVDGPGTSQRHVGRVLRESLHGSGARSFAVAVRIAGIERSIVMEH
jgi:hypothetical protein